VWTNLDTICQIDLKAALVEMCCVGVTVVTCKLGLAVGLGFFQLRVQCFTLYVYSVSNRSIQWAISKIALSNPAT